MDATRQTMRRIVLGLNEALPSPYPYSVNLDTYPVRIYDFHNAAGDRISVQYSLKTSYAGLRQGPASGGRLFSQNDPVVEMDFYAEGLHSSELTQSGDALKVLATVLDTLRSVIKERLGRFPDFDMVLAFGGEKKPGEPESDDAVTQRTRVYRKILARMLKEFPDLKADFQGNVTYVYDKNDEEATAWVEREWTPRD
jgi:hypothetical protein